MYNHQPPIQRSQVLLRKQWEAADRGYGNWEDVTTFIIAEIYVSETGITCLLTAESNPSVSIKVTPDRFALAPDKWFT